MPYIKPKPQQLEHLASASAYDNHKPFPKEEIKSCGEYHGTSYCECFKNQQKPLQTEGSQVTERNKHEDKNSGSLSSPTPSSKGVDIQNTISRGVTEITIMDKTVIHIYQDGSKHLQKHLCQKWIAGMQQVYKQKAKEKQDKKKDLEQIKVVEEESY